MQYRRMTSLPAADLISFLIINELNASNEQQERHKFAYLTIKYSSFTRFVRCVHFCTFWSRSHAFNDVK